MAPRQKKNAYDNESIKSLKGADRVRLRPSVIFGSDGLSGCEHSFFEILSNSIDEAREGFGEVITVTRYKDMSLEVEDFGRGVPVDFNEGEQRYNWELIYCELYAGGKYDNIHGESYEYSLGLNGLGACATQYASEYMDVTAYRDGFKYSLHFERGENIGGLASEPVKTRRTGTITRWRPDLNVFTDINIGEEFFCDVLKKQAVVNAGLRFVLKYETDEGFSTHEFTYKNGIADRVAELAQGEELTSLRVMSAERRGRDRADKPEYKLLMNFAFLFSKSRSAVEYYHNSSFLEHGGSPDKAVRSAFVSAIDAYIRQAGRYTKGESKITFQDVLDCLVLISSSFSTQTSYENQTKKAINNKFIQEAMTEFLRQGLEVYFIENTQEADSICEQALINKRSRESAERARVNIKKKLSGGLDLQNKVQKFVDCRTKDVTRRELYIVEGDSALGACKMGRDSEFQAIIPVRGKILNCLKADVSKIFNNEIITDLIKVLGCGVELKEKGRGGGDFELFSLERLRWSKIIICTDADVDGFHIRTQILAMLYRLAPTLIEAGKVHIVESPLYEITTKKDTYFAYSDAEKNRVVEGLKGAKHTIMRSKGLGENEPEMMWRTTMSPETRKLIRVMPEEAQKTSEVFDLLLGDNLPGRKLFIADHGAEYLELADIS